jgi:hypothetical protein
VRAVEVVASLGFVALALVIVLVWRIGPVVWTLTPSHGLHTGDLLALPALAMAALPHLRLLRAFV